MGRSTEGDHVSDRAAADIPSAASTEPAEHRTFCRICAAACGIVVTVDGEQVVKVRGDADHPVSRGYTCPKGRGLPEWHHADARLDHPLLDGRAVSWDEVLDDLGARITSVVAESGSDAVALYLATGFAYDAAGQVAAFMWHGGVGSTSIYTAATVDNAPALVAAEMVTGNGMLNPVWEPGNGGPVIFVGTNPVVSHGYGTTLPDPVSHLRDHQASGGRVWVLDPRRTETAALADHHLSVAPGSDVEVLAALVSAVLAHGADPMEVEGWCDAADVEELRRVLAPFTLERAAARSGIALADMHELLAEVRACDGRLAVFCGTGPAMGRDGVLAEWLRWCLLVLTGSLDWSGGMRFNRGAVNRLGKWKGDAAPLPGPSSRPDVRRVIGQVPALALVDEIEAGNVRVLVVTGGNPVLAFPEPDRVRAALAKLDALVVIDVADGETAALATHLLPATGQLERADLSLTEGVLLRSGIQATAPVVAPVADRRPSWWILAQLARRHGGDLLGGADPDLLTDEMFLSGLLGHGPLDAAEVFANGPHGTDVAIEHGWVHEQILPDGRWRLAPRELVERIEARTAAPPPDGSLLLVNRREVAWSNSIRYAGAGDEPALRLHPDDAATVGVATAGRVTVTSAHGSIEAVVALDERVRPGTVSLTHGRSRSPAGRLTSATVDVDPLTAMPLASGLPVTVRPA
jgi:anaerobic selenocysteine-containing dehydrogenase